MESRFLLIILLLVILDCTIGMNAAGLKNNFYKKTCPRAEEIVQNIIVNRTASNPALPAKLLRMFFHDCFVRGCDASILLDSANGTAEKDAIPNLSLSGFDVIDDVKAALEVACRGTVSCADIIALSTRDSLSFQFNKTLWEVQTGRRDGKVSLILEALTNIPAPFFNFSTLVRSFASKGLGSDDLVVLSGAHTIGVGHCATFSNRLYNFTGKNDADPSLDPNYVTFLKTKCSGLSDTTTTVPMDPDTSLTLDGNYFTLLRQNKGMFESDAALLTDNRATNLVDKLQNSKNFFNAFKNSMERMGAIGVSTQIDGEIRKKCNVVN